MKKLLAWLLAAAVMTSMLAGCGSTSEEGSETEEEDKGAIIDMYFGVMPDTFDPTSFACNSDTYQVTSLLFEGLTAIGKNGKVTSAGASEWKYEVDERDNKLKLLMKLKSTKWSDSVPVRADDYVFAWKRLLSPANTNPAASLLYPVENARKVKSGEVTVADIGVKAVSENILEITFESDFTDVPYFLECLASPMLVPLREDKVKNDAWTTQLDLFVTNGPFCVKSLSDDRLIIERSTHYNSLRLRQKLNTYVEPYRIIAHFGDPDEAYKLYEDGEYFLVNDFSKESYAKAGKTVETASDLTTYTYFFNTKNALLADKDTRLALSAALDRGEIASIRGCGAEPATGLVPSGVRDTSAKKDFRAVGGDLLSKTDAKPGKTGALRLVYNEDRPYEKEIAEYARQAWKELGFKIEPVPVSGSEIPKIAASGDFDILAMDYVAFTDDAYGFVAPFALEFSGSYVDVTNPDVFYNPHFTGFENDAYNALIESLYTADAKSRTSILHDAEKALLAEAPVAPLFFEKASFVASNLLSKITVDYRGAKDFRKTKLKGYLEINAARAAAEEAAANEVQQ